MRISISVRILGLLIALCLVSTGQAQNKKSTTTPSASNALQAEARLLQIYQQIGGGHTRAALQSAQKLSLDHPNFALAQLVYGDLLQAQVRPLKAMGDVPEATARAAPGVLTELREESLLRIRALREKPPLGQIPSAFVKLSARNKHAIAVDASRARLYLFENTQEGLKLIADYYASVGKLGLEKQSEGDLRTPIGVYFVTNNLDPASLKDLYGAGALPINYPNPYDMRRGKTGSGIWLHGVPSKQFARAPKATDGCVAIANPDLEQVLKKVEIRTTPVVIAANLQWTKQTSSQPEIKAFEEAFSLWEKARASRNVPQIMQSYLPDFNSYGKTLSDWQTQIQTELAANKSGQPSEIKDLSILHAYESAQHATMVVTFNETWKGQKAALTKRQYWLRAASTQGQWKMFFEGLIN